jgi:hypothetical protein
MENAYIYPKPAFDKTQLIILAMPFFVFGMEFDFCHGLNYTSLLPHLDR